MRDTRRNPSGFRSHISAMKVLQTVPHSSESNMAGIDVKPPSSDAFAMPLLGSMTGDGESSGNRDENERKKTVFIFYYAWYGNPEHDGGYIHWNHDVISANPPKQYDPEEMDIGANHFPRIGLYSSNDPAVIALHMRQMKSIGVDVIVVSWWGRDGADGRGVASRSDKMLTILLDAAASVGLKVALHLEPYQDRSPESVKLDLEYIKSKHSGHPGMFKDAQRDNRPWIFVYDSCV